MPILVDSDLHLRSVLGEEKKPLGYQHVHCNINNIVDDFIKNKVVNAWLFYFGNISLWTINFEELILEKLIPNQLFIYDPRLNQFIFD